MVTKDQLLDLDRGWGHQLVVRQLVVGEGTANQEGLCCTWE